LVGDKKDIRPVQILLHQSLNVLRASFGVRSDLTKHVETVGCCLAAGYPGLLPPHMMHGVPPELMAAGVLGPGLLPYARPQLVSCSQY